MVRVAPCQPDSRIALIVAGLLVAPAGRIRRHQARHHAASRRRQGGPCPPASHRRSRCGSDGTGQVYVHVCKSKRKTKDGRICHKADIGRAHKKGGSFRYKPKFFDFPGFWLNNPGTYYWQAYRIACEGSLSDCCQEGPIVRFKVAGG